MGLVMGLKTEGWMPKKKRRQLSIRRNNTAKGLSIDPTSGANITVKISGGIVPNTLTQKIRIIRKNPIIITEIGIISKERETKSGT